MYAGKSRAREKEREGDTRRDRFLVKPRENLRDSREMRERKKAAMVRTHMHARTQAHELSFLYRRFFSLATRIGDREG
jgi:hypothetical protein